MPFLFSALKHPSLRTAFVLIAVFAGFSLFAKSLDTRYLMWQPDIDRYAAEMQGEIGTEESVMLRTGPQSLTSIDLLGAYATACSSAMARHPRWAMPSQDFYRIYQSRSCGTQNIRYVRPSTLWQVDQCALMTAMREALLAPGVVLDNKTRKWKT